MTKEYIYEVKNTANNTVVATFWWDGKKVQCSDPSMIDRLDDVAPNNKTSRHGIEFLKALPMHFKNGYMMAYRVG